MPEFIGIDVDLPSEQKDFVITAEFENAPDRSWRFPASFFQRIVWRIFPSVRKRKKRDIVFQLTSLYWDVHESYRVNEELLILRASEAEGKGLALLKRNLTPEQLEQYENDGCFEVLGNKTGNRYRIRHGRSMNIYELDQQGEEVRGRCFYPQGELVVGDVLLAQKIVLETDESKALAIANKF